MNDDWIKVEDELPELKIPVLVYCYQPHDGKFPRRIKQVSYRFKWDNCDREEFECETGTYGWKVTHWMPLPDDPKEYMTEQMIRKLF